MRIAIAQINTTAGDVPGNRERIAEAWSRASDDGVDLLVVPELAVVGYPPRDLLLRDGVVRAAEQALWDLASRFADGPPAVIGSVARNPADVGHALFNVAAFVRGGDVVAQYAKRLLPTYDVFDETRYFARGSEPVAVEVSRGRRVGLLICEDLWVSDLVRGRRLYRADPPADTAALGVDFVIGISASPYHGGKDAHRRDLFAREARRMGVPLVAVNQVGGNDDVLFDGRSRVFDAQGRVVARLAAFEPDYRVVDLETETTPIRTSEPSEADEIRDALVMGVRDYFAKTGFRSALLGLSGGVDSAVTACIARDALGPENVTAVSMPGPFTSEASRIDAQKTADALGIALVEVSINEPYEAFLEVLGPQFAGRPFDVAEENLQARSRGVVLMALSNKLGHLLLTTGNKSEFSVGYCTLYGDMNGGLSVLADVWKTLVYDVARGYAAQGLIPAHTIERPPSAELRADQTDQDTLPPYAELDRILRMRVEEGLSLRQIIDRGEDATTTERVLKMVERSEYKRRQMAPGLKVTPTAFGVGWRMPIARPVDLSGEV